MPADDPKLRGEFHRFLRGIAGGFSRSKVGGDTSLGIVYGN